MTRTREQLAADLEEAVAFFYEHAGYGWNPLRETEEVGRRRCAEELALAYRTALLEGCQWEWGPDPFPDLSWMGDDERRNDHCVECCYLVKDGKVLNVLGNVVDADETYRRVVEAELAHDVEQELIGTVLSL